MKHIYLFIIVGTFFTGCGKEFLDIKREAHQVVPASAKDFLALMDYKSLMNANSTSRLLLGAGEEYIVADEVYDAINIVNYLPEKRAYTWEKDDLFEDKEFHDWNIMYERIMYTNLVLAGKKSGVSAHETEEWDKLRGTALFHRSWNYFRLMQHFGKPWKKEIENEICPIPFRTDYDLEVKERYLSYKDYYKHMIEAVEEAIQLLPLSQPAKTRPNRSAAHLLLSKIYLQIHDYKKALAHAQECVSLSPDLLDFNQLDQTALFPFKEDYGLSNPEVLFYETSQLAYFMSDKRMNVSESLLDLYGLEDIRGKLFFKKLQDGRRVFNGQISGSNINYFVGLSNAEAYLIIAECLARNNALDDAQAILEKLLMNRYEKGADYTLEKGVSKDQLLRKVLEERRKELCFRAIRWEDLRRLNAEGMYTETLERTVKGELHENKWNTGVWYWGIPNRS